MSVSGIAECFECWLNSGEPFAAYPIVFIKRR